MTARQAKEATLQTVLGLCTTACFKPQPDVACATRVVPRGAKGQSERKNKAAAQAQVAALIKGGSSGSGGGGGGGDGSSGCFGRLV